MIVIIFIIAIISIISIISISIMLFLLKITFISVIFIISYWPLLLFLGTCPVDQDMTLPCIADLPSCVADTQCEKTEKCCKNIKCGYNECMPAVLY